MLQEDAKKLIEESIGVKKEAVLKCTADIAKAASVIIEAYKKGKKVLICGNGGSAADAQHIAAELVGRYKMERKALPAIALTTDTSIITAVGNDYGFEKIFSRQVEALGEKEDVLIAISTSGNSPNVLAAMEEAQKKGMKIIVLAGGTGGTMRGMKCDAMIIAPSNNTPRIQELHITAGHIICELVEKELFG